MDFKAPFGQGPGMFALPRVPPSALSSSCSALSRTRPSTPASVTTQALQTWAADNTGHLLPCRSQCPLCTPSNNRLRALCLEARPWAAGAAFPSLVESQKARSLPIPHFRSPQALTDTCRSSRTQESPTRLPCTWKCRVPASSGSWVLCLRPHFCLTSSPVLS